MVFFMYFNAFYDEEIHWSKASKKMSLSNFSKSKKHLILGPANFSKKSNFNDKTVLSELIPILEIPENYDYYYSIKELANNLNAYQEYEDMFNDAGYKAMENQN